jgi:hypothetical protein
MTDRKEHAMTEVLDKAAVDETVILTEADAIQQAREMLKAAYARVWYQATRSGDDYRAANLGRLSHALEIAESALFDVLNEASSYGYCDASSRVLAESHNPPVPTTESAPQS